MTVIKNGRVVLKDRILEKASILIDDGIIQDISESEVCGGAGAVILDAEGVYIAPGFVDIHCHAGGGCWAYDDPEAAAIYHLKNGTTSLVLTLYHDIGHDGIMTGVRRIKKAMEEDCPGNIAGIHLEGPYLSKKYGASAGTARTPDPDEYKTYIREFGPLIRQWTFTPEVEGTDAFIEAAIAAGITLSIGHSEASPERVFEVVDKGVTICTHMGNATACSIMPSRYDGTQEVTFDQAVMLRDEVMCEVINDKCGVHVRPLMTQFYVKAIGVDRLIGITDSAAGSNDNSDINILNGELYGSKLNMLQVAKNFMENTGLSITETFRVCAINPAKAIGLKEKGEIAVGKHADILMLDEAFNIRDVLLRGVVQ